MRVEDMSEPLASWLQFKRDATSDDGYLGFSYVYVYFLMREPEIELNEIQAVYKDITQSEFVGDRIDALIQHIEAELATFGPGHDPDIADVKTGDIAKARRDTVHFKVRPSELFW
jgi:hypothetical protein